MKNLINNFLPFISFYYQIYKALVDYILPRQGYTQHGEDLIINKIIKLYNIPNDSIYIDIGANHPTRISNTFYFYKKGFKGILIEPIKNFRVLYKLFRKKDIFLDIGIGNKAGIAEFKYTASHVLNNFVEKDKNKVIKKEYLPVLKLEDVILSFKEKINNVFLLSIDVEGLDYEVLMSSGGYISLVYIICIEANTEIEKGSIIHYLVKKNNFRLEREIGCNLIFLNNTLREM